jgi:hypothetical protein
MASIVLRILALTLGLFFVFVGTIKLTPSVNTEIYKEMVSAQLFILGSDSVFTQKKQCTSQLLMQFKLPA